MSWERKNIVSSRGGAEELFLGFGSLDEEKLDKVMKEVIS